MAFGIRYGSRTEARLERDGSATGPYGEAGSARASDCARERTEVSRGHSSRGGKVAKGRTGMDKEER